MLDLVLLDLDRWFSLDVDSVFQGSDLFGFSRITVLQYHIRGTKARRWKKVKVFFDR
jgi:hypothetical protein